MKISIDYAYISALEKFWPYAWIFGAAIASDPWVKAICLLLCYLDLLQVERSAKIESK